LYSNETTYLISGLFQRPNANSILLGSQLCVDEMLWSLAVVNLALIHSRKTRTYEFQTVVATLSACTNKHVSCNNATTGYASAYNLYRALKNSQASVALGGITKWLGRLD
jgi:hypothetical protein